MFPVERQKKILDLLAQKTLLKMNEITSQFDISIETARRDLNLLEKQGKIQKIYGGIKLKETHYGEPAMENRLESKLEIKEQIGKKCSEYISDGDCIYIDSGSTTIHIAKNIKNKKNIVIVTNSIPVVNELLHSDIEVIIIGGKLRHNESSIVAYDYMFNFLSLNITKSFICASGITPEKGVSDYNMEEAITRKKILEISNQIFIAADSSKFGRDVTVGICPIDKIDYIVTDSLINKNTQAAFKKLHCKLVFADQPA